MNAVNKAVKVYTDRGFTVTDIHADLEFDCIRDDVAPIHLEIVPKDEHVHEVERSIRTIKEGTRTMVNGLPYKQYTRTMVQELLRTVTRNLNQLPARDGISDCLSPMMLVTGIGEIDYNKLTLEFGSYVQVHESNERTNDQQPWTFGAIAMSMTWNASGHHNFLNLNTGKLVQRRRYTDLPITQSVIERVKQLAISTGQPPMVQDGLLFEWGESDPITDDDPDDDVDIHNDTDATGSPEQGYHPVTNDDLTIDYPEQHADNALEDGSSVSLTAAKEMRNRSTHGKFWRRLNTKSPWSQIATWTIAPTNQIATWTTAPTNPRT